MPRNPYDRNVKYRLEDTFARGGFWAHPDDPATFERPGVFRGGGADAPWHTSSAEDPVAFVRSFVNIPQAFSGTYISNPYVELVQQI